MATSPHRALRGSPFSRYFRNWYSNASSDLGLRLGIRLLQFILALTIMVLYSRDLRTFTAAGERAPAAWVYAEVVASISIIICLWCTFINANHRVLRLLLDFAVAVLWTAQAGYFGTLYIDARAARERPYLANQRHMKAAVWTGVTCVALWLVSFFQSLVWRCQALRKKISVYKKNRKLRKQTGAMMEIEERGELVQESSIAEEELQHEAASHEEPPPYEESKESGAWAEEKQKQTEVVQKMSLLQEIA